MKLVLASASPRRADLLRTARIPFTVRVADIDETPHPRESPGDYVLRLAQEKARAVPRAPDEIILAADTTVVLKDTILGKPEDAAHARRMMTALAGNRHDVLTGICILHNEGFVTNLAVTGVWIAPLTPEEIEEYAASGEPMDKAGGYAIQGLASRYVERIEGEYANVVGLPVALVYRHLKSLMR